MQFVYLNDDHEDGIINTKEITVSDGVKEATATLWTATLDIDHDIIQTYTQTCKYIIIVSRDIERIIPWLDRFPQKIIVLGEYDYKIPSIVEEKNCYCIPGNIKKNLIYIILNL